MSDKSSKALAVLTSTSPKVRASHFLTGAGKAIASRMQFIRRADHDAAFHALCVGVLLWQAKAQVRHGEFKKWIAAHVPESAYRTCAEYMKLAHAMAERSRLSTEEAFEVSQLNPKGAKSATAKAASAKLDHFIGELSLHELMIKHGVRGVGLKGELTDGDAPAALDEAEQAQQELELIWSQTYEPAKSLAQLLVEKAAALKPDQRDAIEAELKKALQALRAA